jgi:alpha(1,3/1,4) fucosyltransferase
VPRDKKTEFLRPYKFSIAFENESRAGYTSEKIFEAMQGHGVPLYWGNPRIKEEFNPKSFLNYFDFESEEALIEKIIELDRDDAKYFEYLKEPYLSDNQPVEAFNEKKLLDFFEEIFTKPIRPVSKRRSFFFGRWLLVKKDA